MVPGEGLPVISQRYRFVSFYFSASGFRVWLRPRWQRPPLP